MTMFRPASQIREGAGLFVSLTGATNSGKSFSALTLARGIAGEAGKIAVLDTEGGRTLHLKDKFEFDAAIMSAPFRPSAFSDMAREAETSGYSCLVIDSFSMEWAGLGGVLSWHDEELQRMAGDDHAKRERVKMAAWIKPKSAHKAMVASLLQRRIPIIFSIRGEESVKPGENGGKPTTVFKSITDKNFPFEVTVAFRLAAAAKGYIDLSDPATWKMEGAHREIFKHGEQISVEHGAALSRWAKGIAEPKPEKSALAGEGDDAASRGMAVLQVFWTRLSAAEKKAVGGADQLARWKSIAEAADAEQKEEAADV